MGVNKYRYQPPLLKRSSLDSYVYKGPATRIFPIQVFKIHVHQMVNRPKSKYLRVNHYLTSVLALACVGIAVYGYLTIVGNDPNQHPVYKTRLYRPTIVCSLVAIFYFVVLSWEAMTCWMIEYSPVEIANHVWYALTGTVFWAVTAYFLQEGIPANCAGIPKCDMAKAHMYMAWILQSLFALTLLFIPIIYGMARDEVKTALCNHSESKAQGRSGKAKKTTPMATSLG